MSIIYEALKKLERKPLLEGKIFFSEPKKRKSKPLLQWMLSAYIAILCLGTIYLAAQLRGVSKEVQESGKSALLTRTPAPRMPFKTNTYPPAFKPPSVQVAKEKESIPLTLNGILFMDGEYLALLNNRIVKKGDNFFGAYILDIQPQQVELLFKGKNLKLRVPE